jgi:hypothetical protein
MKEAYSKVEAEVLDQHSEASCVPPDPGDFPTKGRCEGYDVPEDGGEDCYGDGVGYNELHFHLFSQLDTA